MLNQLLWRFVVNLNLLFSLSLFMFNTIRTLRYTDLQSFILPILTLSAILQFSWILYCVPYCFVITWETFKMFLFNMHGYIVQHKHWKQLETTLAVKCIKICLKRHKNHEHVRFQFAKLIVLLLLLHTLNCTD